MSAARDVAQFLVSAPPDVDDVLAAAARWRGRAVLARALERVRATVLAPLESPLFAWADDYSPGRFERHALGVYASDRAGYAAQAAAGVWALPDWRSRVRYVSALLVPSRDYLRGREGSYLARLRHAVRIERSTRGA